MSGPSDGRSTGGREDFAAVGNRATEPPSDRADRTHPTRSAPAAHRWGRLARVGARGRLEAELRSIALDLLGPNESDELPEACADWVGAATGAAVSSVSDSALEALVQALDTLLLGAPPEIARQLQWARRRHEAGYV